MSSGAPYCSVLLTIRSFGNSFNINVYKTIFQRCLRLITVNSYFKCIFIESEFIVSFKFHYPVESLSVISLNSCSDLYTADTVIFRKIFPLRNIYMQYRITIREYRSIPFLTDIIIKRNFFLLFISARSLIPFRIIVIICQSQLFFTVYISGIFIIFIVYCLSLTFKTIIISGHSFIERLFHEKKILISYRAFIAVCYICKIIIIIIHVHYIPHVIAGTCTSTHFTGHTVAIDL